MFKNLMNVSLGNILDNHLESRISLVVSVECDTILGAALNAPSQCSFCSLMIRQTGVKVDRQSQPVV